MCNCTSGISRFRVRVFDAPRNDREGIPMNPETLWSWQVWAVLSAVFAALTAIFAKIGVEDINPDLATFIRTIIVLISFSLILFATGQFSRPGPISQKTWIFLVLSGLGTGASWLCYFRALKLGPATLVAPIDKLSVVLVALFGVVFLGERPSLSGWLGIVLIAAGAVLIAFKR
jgi:bacterial/archaeal transporter family protein